MEYNYLVALEGANPITICSVSEHWQAILACAREEEAIWSDTTAWYTPPSFIVELLVMTGFYCRGVVSLGWSGVGVKASGQWQRAFISTTSYGCAGFETTNDKQARLSWIEGLAWSHSLTYRAPLKPTCMQALRLDANDRGRLVDSGRASSKENST